MTERNPNVDPALHSDHGEEARFLAYGQLADEVHAMLKAGKRPNLQDLTDKHPELANEISELIPAMAMLDHLGDEPLASMDGRNRAGVMLGDFRIVREIGRGGMGVVYEAQQVSLDRRVALNVLPFAAVLDQRRLKRFQNEAQVAARLTHQHIVPVYAVGCDRSVHFYAMQFIDGRTLAELSREESSVGLQTTEVADHMNRSHENADRGQRTQVEDAESTSLTNVETADRAAESTLATTQTGTFFERIAGLALQAADALNYAHSEGVVHRDVKPSNLIVSDQGHLWVADFGLAHIYNDQSLTLTGDLIGTLRYMSPEQAAGNRALLDHRTDIYSLGITLYELIVGRPAFTGNDRQALFRDITEREPPLPRSIRKSIPIDLETIVLSAICKDPAKRYATMADFKADLQRFLNKQPIQARRTSLPSRAGTWCRRNPVAAMLGVAVVLLVAITGHTISRWLEFTPPFVYSTNSSLSMRSVAGGLSGFSNISPDGKELAFTNWETGNLAILNLETGHQRNVTTDGYWGLPESQQQWCEWCVWAPDGQQLAYQWILGDAHELRISSRDGSQRRTLMRRENLHYLSPFSWSANGKQILVVQQHGKVKNEFTLVNVADGTADVVLTLPAPIDHSAQLSPSGRYVALHRRNSEHSPRDILMLDVKTKSVTTVVEHPADDAHPEWTPDGRWILFVSNRRGKDGLWALRVGEGKPLGEPRHVSELTSNTEPLGVSRNGSYYYLKTEIDRDLYTVDVDLRSGALDGEPQRPQSNFEGVNMVGAYSPDGKRMAWLSKPTSARQVAQVSVRDLQTGETRDYALNNPIYGLPGPSRAKLQWTSNGSLVFYSHAAGKCFRLDTNTGKVSKFQPPGFHAGRSRYALSNDGRFAYFVDVDADVVRLELGTGNVVKLASPSADVWSIAVSPDGQYLAFATPQALSVLPTEGGQPWVVFRPSAGYQMNVSLAWTPDGDSLIGGVSREGDDSDALWQFFTDDRPARPLGLHGRAISTPSIHPNGATLLYASNGSNAQQRLWALDNLLAHLSSLE